MKVYGMRSTMIPTKQPTSRSSQTLDAPGPNGFSNFFLFLVEYGKLGVYISYTRSIDAMTIGLAKEVGDQGIRVNAVKPGLIYTDIHADGGEVGRVDRLKSGVPMQRGGLPLEVAEAILWLLSDASAYTSASFIDVSGGR